jgi:hypothetical protein
LNRKIKLAVKQLAVIDTLSHPFLSRLMNPGQSPVWQPGQVPAKANARLPSILSDNSASAIRHPSFSC